MDRRKFILALSAGAALLGAPPARAECGGPSALEFVEGLYEKQVRLQAQKTRSTGRNSWSCFPRACAR
jgi:hypothetical protein